MKYCITYNLRHGTAGALYFSLGLHGSTNPIVFCVSNPSLAVRQALKLTEKNQSFRNTKFCWLLPNCGQLATPETMAWNIS